MKKQQIKTLSLWTIICLIGIIAVGSIALAFSGNIQNIENFYEAGATGTSGQELGALASPDIPYDWLRVGGVLHGYGHQSLRTATTTLCAIQSPTSTSTLVYGSAKFDTSSTTAMTVVMAQSATAFATTTQIGSDYLIGADAQGLMVASTSPATLGSGETIFAPSQWFVVSASGGTGTFSPTGTCNAEWISAD